MIVVQNNKMEMENMSTEKIVQPKRVKFGQKYRVKKQIDFVKCVSEMVIWTSIIKQTEDRKIWEAFLPKDHSIEVDTVITFTRWMLDKKTRLMFKDMFPMEQLERELPDQSESELKNEDFVVFQIEGSDVEYSTNLKDVDELEIVVV